MSLSQTIPIYFLMVYHYITCSIFIMYIWHTVLLFRSL